MTRRRRMRIRGSTIVLVVIFAVAAGLYVAIRPAPSSVRHGPPVSTTR